MTHNIFFHGQVVVRGKANTLIFSGLIEFFWSALFSGFQIGEDDYTYSEMVMQQ